MYIACATLQSYKVFSQITIRYRRFELKLRWLISKNNNPLTATDQGILLNIRLSQNYLIRSERPMRSVVLVVIPFSRQIELTVVPYFTARLPSVSPERILW